MILQITRCWEFEPPRIPTPKVIVRWIYNSGVQLGESWASSVVCQGSARDGHQERLPMMHPAGKAVKPWMLRSRKLWPSDVRGRMAVGKACSFEGHVAKGTPHVLCIPVYAGGVAAAPQTHFMDRGRGAQLAQGHKTMCRGRPPLQCLPRGGVAAHDATLLGYARGACPLKRTALDTDSDAYHCQVTS
jgi:hypothetical protein